MPMCRELYPERWDEIARQIKESANWTCEACQRPCRRPEETRMDFVLRLYRDHSETWWSQLSEMEGQQLRMRFNRFCLTTAHLNHIPSDCRDENLKALCAPCHCRMDLQAMGTKKRLKREREGQLRVFDLTHPEPAGHGNNPKRIQIPISLEVNPPVADC